MNFSEIIAADSDVQPGHTAVFLGIRENLYYRAVVEGQDHTSARPIAHESAASLTGTDDRVYRRRLNARNRGKRSSGRQSHFQGDRDGGHSLGKGTALI